MAIVVMEDDPVVRDLMVRVLEMGAYSVLAFEDAQPALDTVDFTGVELVITDLTMPTPGETAIKILRERGIQVPILVISGLLDREKVAYLKALGANETLSKPFGLLVLLDLVRRLL